MKMNNSLKFVKNPKAKVVDALEKLEQEYSIYLDVRQAVVALEGKPINKRLAKSLEALLVSNFDQTYEVGFNLKYSWYELIVSKVINGSLRSINVMPAYQSESNEFSVKRFDELTTPYSVGHVDAIRELKASLPNLLKNIKAVEKAQEKLAAALKDLNRAQYYVTERN